MRFKTVITVLLLVFVVASVAYIAVDESRQAAEAPVPTPGPGAEAQGDATPAEPERVVTAYYFHGDKRCPTCIKLQSYAHEAIQTGFPEELGAGRLRWDVVNVDQAGNTHFVTDFELVSKSVVLAEMNDGRPVRWKNLQRIWDLVHDKAAYVEYIRTNTEEFLGGAS